MTKGAPPPAAPAAPPAPATQAASPRATVPSVLPLDVTSGKGGFGDRILIYGPGGIGKTTLAAHLPGVLFFDLANEAKFLEVSKDRSIPDFPTLRGKLASVAQSPPQGCRSVVIDNTTALEAMMAQHVVEVKKTDKGNKVSSIDGFGWMKGWQFLADEFEGLLADLDRISEKGIHVGLVAHDVSSPVPNPSGEDFIRWEPQLYSGDKKGRGSIRGRVFGWADHVLYIGYDVHVTEQGKAQGTGIRTIHTMELPTHIAKSRTARIQLQYTLEDPGRIWRDLGITQ